MKVWQRSKKVIVLAILAAFGTYGCTAYKVARDERSIGTIIDDETILSKIKYRLLRDDTVKGLDIAVYVYSGKVFLVGVIEKKNQKIQAVKISRGVEGVKSVTTYLLDKNRVTIGKTVDDTNITAKVKTRMIKDKEMKSTQVEVKTILGHVVLLGVVASKKDVHKAIKYARGVDNVTRVKSFLMVE